ncbi:BFH_collapsed_G0021150.mRNA.1.CDS.1 [Saccharomyces cerevisiae]|nr:BFH_collapsed_G0021150.mRNA.1.CDS.1 [Saccharomyces cerevisiae]
MEMTEDFPGYISRQKKTDVEGQKIESSQQIDDAKTVRHKFMTKLDQAPFIPNVRDPKIPKILTLTCGQGRFGADAIIAVYVNRKGESKTYITNSVSRSTGKSI